MYEITRLPSAIDIGFTGEKKFRVIEIDMSKWMEEMPNGIPSIVHIRPGETEADAYIAATTFANNILSWVITAGDVGSVEGSGRAQVWLEETVSSSVDKRGKSAIFTTRIKKAINDASSSVPAAQQAWIDQMTALKNLTVAASEAALEAVTHPPYIDPTTKNWMEWDESTGTYVDTGYPSCGSGGTTDYSDLDNKPSIGGVTLSGNKTLNDLDIASQESVNGKIGYPETQGTEGQVLTLDENLEPVWGSGVDPSSIEDAVEDWLDDHPEATTTVQDGAVTWDKLHSGVANYIEVTKESEEASSFNNQNMLESIKVQGNSLAWGNILLCNRRNIMPVFETYTATHSTKPISATFSDRFISISGSTDGNAGLDYKTAYPDMPSYEAGNYKLIIKQVPNYTSNDSWYVSIKTKDSSGNTKTIKNAYLGTSDTVKTWDVTIDEGYNKGITIKPYLPSGFNGTTKVWLCLVKSTYTITDTEETVAEGSTKTFQIDPTDYPEGVDSLMHSATATYHPTIQEFVEGNTPEGIVKLSDIVFLTPEMFGAVGDDSTDDTTAVQTCINTAITQGVPVRGYGKYKTTSTISIDGTYLDIQLKHIRYTGSSVAVTVAGKYHNIYIENLFATGTGAKGISFIPSTATDATERCVLSGVSINSHGTAISFATQEEGSDWMVYFVIRYKLISSTASDAITAGPRTGEIGVYDARFNCPAGWCFNGVQVKMFNCTMESTCYGGVYAEAATIQNCRARELMDCLMESNPRYGINTGILFKQKGNTTPTVKIDLDDYVYYDAIDLSEAVVPDTGDSDASWKNAQCGIVRSQIILGDFNYEYGMYVLGKEMILHGKDRICVPQFRNAFHVATADFDLRDSAFASSFVASRPPFPTKFIIEVENCVIHLSPSYCAEGYSEFIVDMGTYKATVYDRRGNVIFNPANYQTGVYKFTATVDYTIDTTYQDASGYIYPINSGYCDVWEVEKLS